jgi:hypothetical protein
MILRHAIQPNKPWARPVPGHFASAMGRPTIIDTELHRVILAGQLQWTAWGTDEVQPAE